MPEPAVQPELHTVAHADIPDYIDGGKCPEGPWVDVTKEVKSGEYVAEDDQEGEDEDTSEDEEVVSEDAWAYGDFGLMTEEDLAYAFGLTKNTLAKWRKNTNPEDQSGPSYIRIGKSVFYHEGHVMQWIARNVVHQDPPAPVTKAPGTTQTVAGIAPGANLN